MTQPLLSILIPNTIDRKNDTSRLLQSIENQYRFTNAFLSEKGTPSWIGMEGEDVEVVVCTDSKELTIGEKREAMYKRARGKFSIQIDSDDAISDGAISVILDAIKSNPEIPCITFRENCMMNGVYKSSNHSIIYSKWMDNADGYDYVRCPFYKDVIRTDIAKSVPFEHIRYNEDERWSMAIRPLLTSEIHIDKEIYYYIYNETNHEERYGYDRN